MGPFNKITESGYYNHLSECGPNSNPWCVAERNTMMEAYLDLGLPQRLTFDVKRGFNPVLL